MDISELAAAIDGSGVRFDYLLFDACFMSSVEALYDLRRAADYIVASPCEVMAHGFPYDTVIPSLFADDGARYDLAAACRNVRILQRSGRVRPGADGRRRSRSGVRATDGTLLPARGTIPHGAVLFGLQQSHERHPLLFGRNDLCSGRDLPQRVATDRVVCRDEEITTRYPDTNSPLPHCLRQG